MERRKDSLAAACRNSSLAPAAKNGSYDRLFWAYPINLSYCLSSEPAAADRVFWEKAVLAASGLENIRQNIHESLPKLSPFL